MMTMALLSMIFKKRLVLNIHTNVHQMLATRPFMKPIANFVYHQFLRTALCSSRVKCYTVSSNNQKVLESNGVTVSGVYELSTREDAVEGMAEADIKALREQLAPGLKEGTKLVLFAGRWLEEKVRHGECQVASLMPTLNPGERVSKQGASLSSYIH